MPPVAFRCPLCQKPFQVAAEHQGQAVACPHCGEAVAIPPPPPPPAALAEADSSPPPRFESHTDVPRESRCAPPITPQHRAWPGPPGSGAAPGFQVRESTTTTIQLDGQAYEVRSLTPQERAAFRRRVNACIVGVTATLLALAVAALLLWRG